MNDYISRIQFILVVEDFVLEREEMDYSVVFLMLLCFVLIAGTSVAVEDHQYLYHHFNSLQPIPSHYVMNERMSMLQESGKSMARHKKRDGEALLSFRNAVTVDPQLCQHMLVEWHSLQKT